MLPIPMRVSSTILFLLYVPLLMINRSSSASAADLTTAEAAEMPREPPFDVEESDLVSCFASSIDARLVVAHASRAWRGPLVRAFIAVNGSEALAQVQLGCVLMAASVTSQRVK